jgi:hypothetical protein
MKIRALGMAAGFAIAFAGCNKQSQSPASLPSTNAASATAAAPAMQTFITDWQRGRRSEAINGFLAADWSARPLFAPDSILSLSEAQFQSQIKALSTASEVQDKRTEMMTELNAVKQLAASVAQAGADAASRGDLAGARKHFDSLKQCGEALDNSNSLAIVRLVGQGMKKRADTGMSKLAP